MKYWICSVWSFTSITRLQVSTKELNRLPVKFSLLTSYSKGGGGGMFPCKRNHTFTWGFILFFYTSSEAFSVSLYPPVNFQYLMHWQTLAVSGNPQWCDWGISRYTVVTYFLLHRDGSTDNAQNLERNAYLCCNDAICAAVLVWTEAQIVCIWSLLFMKACDRLYARTPMCVCVRKRDREK